LTVTWECIPRINKTKLIMTSRYLGLQVPEVPLSLRNSPALA